MTMISLGVWGASRSSVLRSGALTGTCARREIELTFGLSKKADDKPASKFVVPLRIQPSEHVDQSEFVPKTV
jgi:hypothetical protein